MNVTKIVINYNNGRSRVINVLNDGKIPPSNPVPNYAWTINFPVVSSIRIEFKNGNVITIRHSDATSDSFNIPVIEWEGDRPNFREEKPPNYLS